MVVDAVVGDLPSPLGAQLLREESPVRQLHEHDRVPDGEALRDGPHAFEGRRKAGGIEGTLVEILPPRAGDREQHDARLGRSDRAAGELREKHAASELRERGRELLGPLPPEIPLSLRQEKHVGTAGPLLPP